MKNLRIPSHIIEPGWKAHSRLLTNLGSKSIWITLATRLKRGLESVQSHPDDLHSRLYHPELAKNWQRALYPNLFHPVKKIVAAILTAVATLAFADSVSHVLTNGKSVFHGWGTTGLGSRQLLALVFALTVLLWLLRLSNSKMQTQGYLDGYSDGHLHLKSKQQTSRSFHQRRETIIEADVEHDVTGELVAWMPALERGSPRFVNPWKEARQIVGAIAGVRGQALDADFYLWLLADRFNWMLAREDDPESTLEEIFSWLESEGLAENCPDSLEEAGRELIINNPFIQERLYLMGVPGKLPRKLTNTDPLAAKVMRETNLTQWIIALCNKPSDPFVR